VASDVIEAPDPQTGSLADKVVVITGASSGIGAEAARLFAQEGAAVVLGARSEERLAEVAESLTSQGFDAIGVRTDVSRAADVQALVDAAVARHGRIDGGLNNAGITQGGGALADVSEERFDQLIGVNLRGVWLSIRAEVRAMLAAGVRGSIVNVSSVGGISGVANASGYLATKHGVIGLTRGAAYDYGPQGIRVNALAPGTTDTEMIVAWKEREPGIEDRLNAMTPLGRAGRPVEVAEAAAWLLSDRSSYVHGAVLPVDGGMTA
jgi:A-factor type gamma-butyrolactone 1'-reductase (1S-forming)